MSQEPNEQTQKREEALRRHQQQRNKTDATGRDGAPEGIIPVLAAWTGAALEVVKRRLRWLGPVIKPFTWSAIKAADVLLWHWNSIAFENNEKGHKRFSAKKLATSLVMDAAVLAALPVIIAGGYYHATLKTYHDVFIPNAGVFVNQQFIHPSQPGHIIAPRDEIFTVLGQHLDEKGKVESIRFDVDSNLYFFYKHDALRPDLLAAKMVPISPYGAMCNVEATGIYTRLARPLRVNIVKWLDLRTEIVGIKGDCIQLESTPQQYHQGNAPTTPVVAQHPVHPSHPGPSFKISYFQLNHNQ